MSKIADMTGGKPIAISSQSISDVNAINPLVAFHNIHGRKREVLFFYLVPDTTRDLKVNRLERDFLKRKLSWQIKVNNYCQTSAPDAIITPITIEIATLLLRITTHCTANYRVNKESVIHAIFLF
jgi:hypothetical protein